MKQEINSIEFAPCPESWREGYLIPVRNRLSNMLQNEFLPEQLKEKYIEDLGNQIVYDDQFIDWYCEIKKNEGR